ncbi:MAG: aminotransferase class V-fold PLP-dependent enzyme [Geminicoccaceae bacterium]|nr:aminotransferase class V-fold PLP-dependent enzyme [Geminicoccaceae bacterium]
MTLPGRIFLHSPGPTNIPDRVLRAMHRPCEDFAAPAFQDLARSCLSDLSRVFRTEGESFAFSTNGHGTWEIPLVNLVEPGSAVLVPLAGRFSGAWAEMAEKLGLEVITTPPDLGRAVDPQAVEDALRADKAGRIAAVLTVHTETASSARTDLEAVRAAIDAVGHPALYVVDAIASLAVERFEMDAWKIDCALTASQKGLMLPPGMGFAALGERAMQVAERCSHPRRYWDIQFRRGDAGYQWFHGTPPLQHVWGLREALDMIFEQGLDAVIARHARLAEATRAAVAHWSQAGTLDFQTVRPEERSNAVTAIRTTDGTDPETMRKRARERYNVVLGGGLGELQGRVFRIGHLGDLNEPMLLGALATVELAMRDTALACTEGGVVAAVRALSTR